MPSFTMPSGGGLMTDSFIPSWRSAFLPASMYKVPSDTCFTWKTTGFSRGAACAGVCAFARVKKPPVSRQVRSIAASSNTAVVRMLTPTAVLVAVVASGGAVAITTYALMRVVCLSLLVRRLRVAINAGKAGVIRGNLVAVVARWGIRFVVGDREEIAVIERGSEPACRRVAGIARRWITGRNMVGHRAAQGLRAVPIGNVAAIADGIRGGQRVIVANVALRASGDDAAGGRYHLVSTG